MHYQEEGDKSSLKETSASDVAATLWSGLKIANPSVWHVAGETARLSREKIR